MTLRLISASALWASIVSLALAGTLDDPNDWVVSRAGPEWSRNFDPPGRFGILLTSYQRTLLYEAYRTMVLGKEAVEAENHEPEVSKAPGDDPIETWQTARQSVSSAAPHRELGMERRLAADVLGSYVNCGPGAFRLAAHTLDELRQRKGITPADLRLWVAAQDAVFEFCTYVPGAPAAKGRAEPPAPAIPAPLPPKADPVLRQLRDYQIATAHFYAGHHAEARSRFDAMGRTAGHPMRAWAALAAMRASLREASLDLGFLREFYATRRAGLGEADRKARLAAAGARMRERNAAALNAIAPSVKAVLGDPELKVVHGATRALAEQALEMLAPTDFFLLLTERLNQLQQNPYTHETLWRWQRASDQLLDHGPAKDLTALRRKYLYLDWIRTIQACADNPASPNYTNRCVLEHAHALERWGEGREPAWLVAAMMTAPALTSENEAALRAALGVRPEAAEWLTLRYHAARLLRLAGRKAEAVKILDEALAGDPVPVGSDRHLLLQERLAVSSSLGEIGPYLLRGPSDEYVRLGADGDELLNRVLGAEDLLALAAAPGTPEPLRRELEVAAWFRADLVQDSRIAEAAAKRVKAGVPALAGQVEQYLRAGDPEQRRWAMMATALNFRVSPVVGEVGRNRGGAEFPAPRTGRSIPSPWCSFDPAQFKKEQQAERMLPIPQLNLRRGAAEEQAKLRALGPFSSVLADRVFAGIRKKIFARETRQRLLEMVEQAADDESCPNPDAARLAAEAKRLASEP